jgi:hypothetical protein
VPSAFWLGISARLSNNLHLSAALVFVAVPRFVP